MTWSRDGSCTGRRWSGHPEDPVPTRRRRYGAVVADVARVVWESLDYVCAERLTPTGLIGKTATGIGLGYQRLDPPGQCVALYDQPAAIYASTNPGVCGRRSTRLGNAGGKVLSPLVQPIERRRHSSGNVASKIRVQAASTVTFSSTLVASARPWRFRWKPASRE